MVNPLLLWLQLETQQMVPQYKTKNCMLLHHHFITPQVNAKSIAIYLCFMCCYSLVTWGLQWICRTIKISENVDTVVLRPLTLHMKRERNWNGVELPSKYWPKVKKHIHSSIQQTR